IDLQFNRSLVMRKVLTFACAACIVLAIVINHADAASDSLTDLQLVVVNVVPSGKITVRMANGSHHKPRRVWTEANSWGALRRRVVIIRKGRRLTIFEDPDGVGFTKNTPQFDNLAAGGHIDRQLDL